MVVIDHLQVERQVVTATTSLKEAVIVVSLGDTFGEVILQLLHVITHLLNLRKRSIVKI